MSQDNTQAELFQKYLAPRKLLIADASSSSRSNLAQVMVKLGAKMQNIQLAANFDAAEADINARKPEIVICDYDLGKGRGLDLLQRMRQHQPEMKKCLFVLVTGNTSQSTVARAAEEDVDTFILKPFTADTLRQAVMKAVIAKVSPSTYVKTIDMGKEHMEAGEMDQALQAFDTAMNMDPAPALAHFYHGQVEILRQLMSEAEGSFEEGLGYNKIHFKCLVGLYELFMSRKEYKKAYEVVKKVSRYFPANPERLSAVLRLAIMNQAYDDVERYYQIFTNLDARSDEIIKYICAALVVCGKFYLQGSHNTRALELFQKAAVTASGRTRILKEIITSLLEYDMSKEAVEYLKRFPQELRSTPEYYLLDLMIYDNTAEPSQTVSQGRKLIQQGVQDPEIFKLLLTRAKESGPKDFTEWLYQESIRLWPDQKAVFTKVWETPAPVADTGS